MAITNVTDEVQQLRAEKEIQVRIELLSAERAQFALKTLLMAGHVSRHEMDLVTGLALTVATE